MVSRYIFLFLSLSCFPRLSATSKTPFQISKRRGVHPTTQSHHRSRPSFHLTHSLRRNSTDTSRSFYRRIVIEAGDHNDACTRVRQKVLSRVSLDYSLDTSALSSLGLLDPVLLHPLTLSPLISLPSNPHRINSLELAERYVAKFSAQCPPYFRGGCA